MLQYILGILGCQINFLVRINSSYFSVSIRKPTLMVHTYISMLAVLFLLAFTKVSAFYDPATMVISRPHPRAAALRGRSSLHMIKFFRRWKRDTMDIPSTSPTEPDLPLDPESKKWRAPQQITTTSTNHFSRHMTDDDKEAYVKMVTDNKRFDRGGGADSRWIINKNVGKPKKIRQELPLEKEERERASRIPNSTIANETGVPSESWSSILGRRKAKGGTKDATFPSRNLDEEAKQAFVNMVTSQGRFGAFKAVPSAEPDDAVSDLEEDSRDFDAIAVRDAGVGDDSNFEEADTLVDRELDDQAIALPTAVSGVKVRQPSAPPPVLQLSPLFPTLLPPRVPKTPHLRMPPPPPPRHPTSAPASRRQPSLSSRSWPRPTPPGRRGRRRGRGRGLPPRRRRRVSASRRPGRGRDSLRRGRGRGGRRKGS